MNIGMSMSIGMEQRQSLEQRMSLRQCHAIESGNLLKIPDELMNHFINAINYNPESIEKSLREREESKKTISDTAQKIQVIYSTNSSNPDSPRRCGGIITEPNIQGVESHIANSGEITITPDVTYIAREGNKPEIVLSDHLKAGPRQLMINLNEEQYPETTKILKALANFDKWKREILREAYVQIGAEQREYFERFNEIRMNVFNQGQLAHMIGISESMTSRVLCNRMIEARNLEGEVKYMSPKDLLATQDDVFRINITPELNKVMEYEFKNSVALSDDKIAKTVGKKLARRTVAKYRLESGIPVFGERQLAYKQGKKEQYQFMR